MSRALVVVAALALSMPARAVVTEVSCLGDSITYGLGIAGVTVPFPAKVETDLGASYRVINRGISGNTTDQMSARYCNESVFADRYEVLVFLGGINDLKPSGSEASSSVFAMVEPILDDALEVGRVVVIGVGPANGSSGWTGAHTTEAKAYNALLEAWADANGMEYVDIYSVLDADDDDIIDAALRADFIHPNQDGLDLIAGLVGTAILAGSDAPGATGRSESCPWRPYRVAALGDTLTLTTLASAQVAWPILLETGLAAAIPTGAAVTVVATTGATASTISTAWTSSVKGKGYDAIVLVGGSYDMIAGTSGATAWSSLDTVITEALAQDIAVVVATVPPWGDYTSWTAGKQTETEALNTSISGRASVTVYDAYTDLADPADLDALLPAYALFWGGGSDGLLLGDDGHERFAAQVQTALGY